MARQPCGNIHFVDEGRIDFWAYSRIAIAGMIRKILCFRADLILDILDTTYSIKV